MKYFKYRKLINIDTSNNMITSYLSTRSKSQKITFSIKTFYKIKNNFNLKTIVQVCICVCVCAHACVRVKFGSKDFLKCIVFKVVIK